MEKCFPNYLQSEIGIRFTDNNQYLMLQALSDKFKPTGQKQSRQAIAFIKVIQENSTINITTLLPQQPKNQEKWKPYYFINVPIRK